MRKPPRATSATALVTTSPLVPVTASFLCWGAGVGIAEGVGSLYRSITGVGSGTGLRVGVVLGLGVGVADGLGVGVDGVVDGLGVGVTDGLGADGLGLGDADGVGVTDGVGSGVGLVDGVGAGADGLGLGAGVGVGVNPALPPDSRRTTRVLTSQDLSWEVMVAESLHGPGSAASTPTFSWSRAFSPVLSVTLSVALLLSQLTTVGSWNRSYIGWPQGPAEWYTPTRPTSRSLHTNC